MLYLVTLKIVIDVGQLNTLPNNRILDWSKFKAFADNKSNVIEKLKFVLQRTESMVGKGENAGFQHFLLFPLCFQRPLSWVSLKVGIVWSRVKPLQYSVPFDTKFVC